MTQERCVFATEAAFHDCLEALEKGQFRREWRLLSAEAPMLSGALRGDRHTCVFQFLGPPERLSSFRDFLLVHADELHCSLRPLDEVVRLRSARPGGQ